MTQPGGQAAKGGSAIRAEDLRKTYQSTRGDVQAVRGIDLDVGTGEFFGLLGPNGAGKSTTIGMLTTLVLPTSGRAWVAGTVDELKSGAGADTVITVRYEGGTPDRLALETQLDSRPGISKVETEGDQVRVFTKEPDGVLGELVTAEASAGPPCAMPPSSSRRPSPAGC